MSLEPLVSLGIPACNGQAYLCETLDSLLAQDYRNLEILISDNASTDKTAEIGREYERRDRRVRYFRNEKNLGMCRNFSKLFMGASGEYFMWVGQHDLLDRNFIGACAEVLEQNPHVVLCAGQYSHIDAGGRMLQDRPVSLDTRGMSRRERFGKMLNDPRICLAIYSLMRSSAVKKTHLFRETYFPDLNFFAELSLRGDFCSTPKAGMHLRVFEDRDRAEGGDEFLRVCRLIAPERARSLRGLFMARFPFLQYFLVSLGTLFGSDLGFFQKLTLIPAVFGKWRGNLARELTTRWLPRNTRKFLKRFAGAQ